MSSRKTKKVSGDGDALRMLESLIHGDSKMGQLLAEERSNAAVARQIHERRTAKGLTQKQLAELIGTQQPVIARLESSWKRNSLPVTRSHLPTQPTISTVRSRSHGRGLYIGTRAPRCSTVRCLNRRPKGYFTGNCTAISCSRSTWRTSLG